jgi:hypothetical protein
MTPLTELVDAASGDAVPVSTLLRKVKVIASRLKVGELESWVDHELAGYPPDAELPEYRVRSRQRYLVTLAARLGAHIEMLRSRRLASLTKCDVAIFSMLSTASRSQNSSGCHVRTSSRPHGLPTQSP